MLITVNGVEEQGAYATLADLVVSKGVRQDSLVVELNGSIIKQADWKTTGLDDGDQVELLNFVGGG